MLSALVLTLLTQTEECRFKADWLLPASVNVRTPSGARLGVIGDSSRGWAPAPKADVLLSNEGAVIALSHRGIRLNLIAKSLPVSTNPPRHFGHGHRSTRSSLLKVINVDGQFVDVIPWLPPGARTSFEWIPQRVACADLRLSARTRFACETSEPVARVSSRPDGPIEWTVPYTMLTTHGDEADVTLLDGSVVHGWTHDRLDDDGVSSLRSCLECGFGEVDPPVHVCPQTVPLFSLTEERIGELQADTPFSAITVTDDWVVLRPHSFGGEIKPTMRRADFDACVGVNQPTRH